MRSKGAALALTLPGVENRLLAAATHAIGDRPLHQQNAEAVERKTAKCGVLRTRPGSRTWTHHLGAESMPLM